MGALHEMHANARLCSVKRQVQRAQLNTPVVLTLHGQGFRGWMNDVSEQGIGVISAAPLNRGDEIGVTVNLPGEAPPLMLRAVVRHTRGFHHGCQFLEPYRDQRYFLRQLVTEVTIAV